MPRLEGTRAEAQSIVALAPGHSKLALDFEASRTTATSCELTQYRYLHFATHGLVDTQHPELSGLVLSMVNERGEPVNGFLRLQDIFNLNLPVELVVLSACETGIGKEVRGEGLLGLTRGFMYAGAPRVVVSLWKVDDAATAELMGRFYDGMLRQKLRPAAALRAAQLGCGRTRSGGHRTTGQRLCCRANGTELVVEIAVRSTSTISLNPQLSRLVTRAGFSYLPI